MEAKDYVAAYRKIIPSNLRRWVVFRHGTVFVPPENTPVSQPIDLQDEAIAFLRKHGPVSAGSAAGDFSSFPLKDDLGWLVRYPQDGIFNFIPAAECSEPPQELVIGLAGREHRTKDAAELDVIHVEYPGDDDARR